MNDWFDAEHHVERAHEFYELGKWDEAETELREALARNPYQAEWHFNLGLTLEAAGRYADAVEAFLRVHDLTPEDGQAVLLAGINALRADRLEDAIRWLEQAEKLSPRSTESYVHRIEAYARLGQHERAEEMFYLAQEIDASDAEIYSAMAESLMDRRLHDKAVWCLREAARLDPELPRVQARLAEGYAATGRQERARQLYLRELQRDPGDSETLLDLGELLADMGRFAEAGEKFRRVLEIEPDNVDAHFALGDLAERMGDSRAALRQYEVVLRLDGGFPEARRRVAGVILGSLEGEDLSLAHRLLRMDLRDVRDRPRDFSDADLEQLGTLLLDAHLSREAVEVFGMLVERSPSHARHHHMLGVARFESGDIEGGIESSRTSVEMDPRLVPAMHNLALAFLQQGQWTRTRYWLRQGLSVRHDDPSLRRLRVRMRLRAVAEVFRWLSRRVTPRR